MLRVPVEFSLLAHLQSSTSAQEMQPGKKGSFTQTCHINSKEKLAYANECFVKKIVAVLKDIQILHLSSLASWCLSCWGWAAGEQPCHPTQGNQPRGSSRRILLSLQTLKLPLDAQGGFAYLSSQAQPPTDRAHQLNFVPPLACAGVWNHPTKTAPV